MVPSASSSVAGRSLEESVDLLPQGEPEIPFLYGQLFECARPAHPGQVRVGQPSCQPLLNEVTIRRGPGVQFPGPGNTVEFQPIVCPLAPGAFARPG